MKIHDRTKSDIVGRIKLDMPFEVKYATTMPNLMLALISLLRNFYRWSLDLLGALQTPTLQSVLADDCNIYIDILVARRPKPPSAHRFRRTCELVAWGGNAVSFCFHRGLQALPTRFIKTVFTSLRAQRYPGLRTYRERRRDVEGEEVIERGCVGCSSIHP